MWNFIIYGMMGNEFSMHLSEGNFEEIFDWKIGKERVHSEALCECGRTILKWILGNCFRMNFD
jgi:hypothetical protein